MYNSDKNLYILLLEKINIKLLLLKLINYYQRKTYFEKFDSNKNLYI